MIQFNMLPQVKVDYIKTKRLKRTIIGVALLAMAVSVVLLILTFSVKAVQSRHLSNLDEDIAELTKELESIPELNKIISVQNQLGTLPELYDGRPAINRLPTYLDQTTPTNVGISSIEIDLSESGVEIRGTAENLEAVNRYIDTLKFTTYKSGEDMASAFTEVIVTSFGREENSASFSVTFKFDPVIFDSTKEVSLVIPSIVTTRSQVNTDIDIFNEGGSH